MPVSGTPWGTDALDMTEAAALLEYTESTLRTKYKELAVPHERVAGRIIFIKPVLEAWKVHHTRYRINGTYIHNKSAEDADGFKRAGDF